MRVWTSGRWVALGAVLALTATVCLQPAEAAKRTEVRANVQSVGNAAKLRIATREANVRVNARALQAGSMAYQRRGRWSSPARYGNVGGGLQCVPFARENSGIEITGDAHTWWDSADGIYERGARPEVGSVLSFRSNGRMRLGHVAVVSRVVTPRTVEIDHANWSGPGIGRGRITRNVDVVDVSPMNDWSAVRVAVGQSEAFGSIYPTNGFIYDRPDRGTMVANAGAAPMPELNAPIRDLRPASERVLVSPGAEQDIEVADAGDDQPRVRSTFRTRSSRAAAVAQARSPRVVAVRASTVGRAAAVRTVRGRNAEIRAVGVRSQPVAKTPSRITRPRT